MNFLLCGNSGVGKTTLAMVLKKIFGSDLKVIHGDDFVTQNEIDWVGLKGVFETEKPIFFEHVSPIAIFEALNISYDIVFFIDDIQHWNNTTKREYQKAITLNKKIIIGQSFNDLLNEILNLLSVNLNIYPAKILNFVLKVATHCNLNCSYCYMYEYFDNGKQLPSKIMSFECFRQSIKLINEYSLTFNLKVSIGLHGGEPLLVGYERLKQYLIIFNEYKKNNPLLNITIQTNGVLLNVPILNLLQEYGVSIGISIDGFNEITNSKRNYHSGKNSFNDVVKAIELLNNNLFTNYGILSVIDNQIEFDKIIEFTKIHRITSYEFLIKDITHDNKQEKINLFELFKSWVTSDTEIDIRFFKSLLSQACGYNWSVDTVGISPISTLVINTSGEWELLDTLRIVKPNSWKVPYTIYDTNIIGLLSKEEMQKYYITFLNFSETCLACKYFLSCGSGYIVHRYSTENNFLNPSVYCEDLTKIFNFIHTEILQTA